MRGVEAGLTNYSSFCKTVHSLLYRGAPSGRENNSIRYVVGNALFSQLVLSHNNNNICMPSQTKLLH